MDLATLIVTLGAAITAVAGWWKWVRPRIQRAKAHAEALSTAIVGRDAIIHPETGRELAPAVPGMGARQANIESQMTTLATAVAQIADTHQRVDSLEDKHERLTDRVEQLENSAAERLVARTESVGLLRTIETAIKSQPPTDGD